LHLPRADVSSGVRELAPNPRRSRGPVRRQHDRPRHHAEPGGVPGHRIAPVCQIERGLLLATLAACPLGRPLVFLSRMPNTNIEKGPFMSLANKVVLITGAGTGIGAAPPRAFHAAGCSIVLNGRRRSALEQTAS